MASFRENIFTYLQSLRAKGIGLDFVIALECGERFEVHGAIFSGSSAVIREAWENDLRHLGIRGCSADGLNLYIDYVYTNKVRFTEDTVLEGLKAANALKSPHFRKECIQNIMSRISCGTCIKYYKISILYDLKDVREKTVKYLSQNLIVISDTEVFKSLNTEEIICLLIKDLLKFKLKTNEFIVACIEWCSANEDVDPVELMGQFSFLSDDLKPLYLAQDYFESRKKTPVKGRILRAIEKAMKARRPNFAHLPEGNASTLPENTASLLPEANEEPTVFLGVAGPRLIFYEARSGLRFSDHNLRDGLIPDKLTQCISSGDELFFVGGSESALFASYHISTDKWTFLPPTLLAGYARALAIYQDRFFSVGGVLNGRHSSLADCYVADIRRWVKLPDHPVQACNRSACLFTGKLIISGGEAPQDEVLSRIDEYDVEKNRWRHLGEMLAGRSGHFTCGFRGKMFIIGASDRSLPLVEGFDMATHQSSILECSAKIRNTSVFSRMSFRSFPGIVCIHDANTDNIIRLDLRTGKCVTWTLPGLGADRLEDVCEVHLVKASGLTEAMLPGMHRALSVNH